MWDDDPEPDSLLVGPYNAASPLVTPTYDGSGQATHPDVLYVPEGFGGFDYWMALTPYPGSNDDYENASILASDDGLTWAVPPGLTNPISPEPVPGFSSDVDLLLVNDTLWCVYRDVISGTEYLRARSSTDGVTWSSPVDLLSKASSTEALLSPTILWDGSRFVMWTINHLTNTCRRRAASSITGPWSSPTTCVMPSPPGRILWHLDVVLDSSGYHCLLDTAINTSGAAAKLHIARSSNGIDWSVSDVVIDAAAPGSWDDELIYRGSFFRAGNRYRVWYSAMKSTSVWHIGYTEVSTAEAPARPT